MGVPTACSSLMSAGSISQPGAEPMGMYAFKNNLPATSSAPPMLHFSKDLLTLKILQSQLHVINNKDNFLQHHRQ